MFRMNLTEKVLFLLMMTKEIFLEKERMRNVGRNNDETHNH